MTAYEIAVHTLRNLVITTIECSEESLNNSNSLAYMKVNAMSDSYEMPIIMTESIKRCKDDIDVVYMPIRLVSIIRIAKSPQSLVGECSKLDDELFRKIELKNNLYYVGRGMILYDDYVPMFSYKVKVSKNNGKLFRVRHGFHNVTLKINKRVFTSDDAVSKFVRNQIIPKTLDINDCYLACAGEVVYNVDVSICGNPNDVVEICKPMLPTSSTTLVDIDGFLKRNIDKLMLNDSRQ